MVRFMLIPDGLKWLSKNKDGRQWLKSLPDLLDQICRDWSLSLVDSPFEGSAVSYVHPVRHENEAHILKLQYPHPDCVDEARALKVWNGEGAVKLIAHDAERWALLLEACDPGTALSAAKGIDPLSVYSNLLPKLSIKTQEPFTPLKTEALDWRRVLSDAYDCEASFEVRGLITAALDLLEPLLVADQGEQVLLHQDLHAENILKSNKRGWLAIDPKPLIGERPFAAAPIVRAFELGHSEQAVHDRLRRLCRCLELDRERARAWTIIQTMAWSFDSAYKTKHHQTVAWLLKLH